jgi:phosphoribosylformylglycinamidine synthase
MTFLHKGIPKVTKKAFWREPRLREPQLRCPADLRDLLLNVLAHANVCSKEGVIRQYDHEVQGGSVVKPLCGAEADGPSDASVIRPNLESYRGFAVANGINCRFGMIDPYWMAASCIDEAIRQIIAVGGDPQRIALLDNFCWGNPDKPDRLGGLVRAAQACHKFAVAYGTPFISGKDSLYTEFTLGRESIAIPGTLLISSLGVLADVRRCVTMDFKNRET